MSNNYTKAVSCRQCQYQHSITENVAILEHQHGSPIFSERMAMSEIGLKKAIDCPKCNHEYATITLTPKGCLRVSEDEILSR